jgi:hypothetical protein
MAIIELNASDPKFYGSRSKDGTTASRVSFSSRLGGSLGHEVSLKVGVGDLRELRGTITFATDAATHGNGSLTYSDTKGHGFFPPSHTYYVYLLIGPNELDHVHTMALSGMSLSVTVSSQGLTYGSAPDGSAVEWDNEANPEITVDSYTYQFEREDEYEEPAYVEPVAAPVDHTPALVAAVRETNRLVGMLLVVVFVAVLAWRFWPR